ncbi:MAG: hypothetical protein J6Y23_00150 [Prevotella sp.]|nr:hypothetical protein [Prevotella sp.]
MKRTGKNSKIGLSYRFTWIEDCPWLYQYDRKYVARHHGDVKHLPFSRTNSGFWKSSFFKWGVRRYIERFLLKHVGMDADTVFHKFSRMGWRNSYDMYEMWCRYVDECHNCPKKQYYVSKEGILEANYEDSPSENWPDEPEEIEERHISEKHCYRRPPYGLKPHS